MKLFYLVEMTFSALQFQVVHSNEAQPRKACLDVAKLRTDCAFKCTSLLKFELDLASTNPTALHQ